MEHFKIFEDLKATNSVVEKEDLLRKQLGTEFEDGIATLIECNLNPYKLFYIREMPSYVQSRPPWKSHRAAYKEFLLLVNKLSQRTITGNEAKDEIKRVFSNITPSEAEIYKKILLKESIGVGAKTVNKVWSGLVPEFNIMLAPNELPDITKVKYPTYIQPKLDGFRCVYVNGEFWSRSGRPFANENLKKHLQCVLNVNDWALDGELYDHTINFNKLTSILNNETAPIPATVKYRVYDCVEIDEWDTQTSKVPYEDRLKNLRTVLNNTIADYKKVIDVPTDLVHTSKDLVDIYKNYLNKGYEGAMIKAPDGIYKWKRTTVKSGEMLKVKPFKSADVVIKGIYAGEGNFVGLAGGVDVDYCGVTVSVGSGFDLPTRKKMAESPDDYIGKTVEIKYFEETADGSLRFPTFIRFRGDKD